MVSVSTKMSSQEVREISLRSRKGKGKVGEDKSKKRGCVEVSNRVLKDLILMFSKAQIGRSEPLVNCILVSFMIM